MIYLQHYLRAQALFTPAEYKKYNSGNVIVYSVYNPINDSYVRHKVRVKKMMKICHCEDESPIAIPQLLNMVNKWLKKEYSKQVLSKYTLVSDSRRYYTPLKDVLQKYIEERTQELKPATCRSYVAFCKQLMTYIKTRKPNCTADEFDQVDAVKYMEFVNEGGNSNGKKVGAPKHKANMVSPSTYNNNVKLARAFWRWAVEKCYASENPFAKIKLKRTEQKKRVLIPIEDRIRIYNYFQKYRPEMCIVMQMVYVSLLRPVEITRVQVKQINFEDHCIEMPYTKTKNGKARVGRMDEALEALLRKHIEGAGPEDYLFANKTWRCGKIPMSNHTFANYWLAMRKELELPASYQLYSLRDCGVNNMLEAGISPLDTMQAAGHSDLSMTTRYANHENKKLVQTLNEKAPSLFGEIKSPEGKTPPSSDETSHAH